MVSEETAPKEPRPQTVVFKPPICRPGTPEANRHGCTCRFESNLNASILAAEQKDSDMTYVVINKGCPLHQIIDGPPPESE